MFGFIFIVFMGGDRMDDVSRAIPSFVFFKIIGSQLHMLEDFFSPPITDKVTGIIHIRNIFTFINKLC